MNNQIMKFLQKLMKNANLSQIDFKKAWSVVMNLGEHVDDFKLLLQMATDTVQGKYKMEKSSMLLLVGGIVYVFTPLDVIPDFIPVLGWSDDIAVISYVLVQLSAEIHKYKIWQQQRPRLSN